ncbi:hypothetical protein AYI68_g4043 [Smittium mucronatum]|uniref:GLTSCR protein conserved domain-containing protein n=1 Tax=Smittium mucronatum TaxID=133383 RepID=A0A1R0GY88_9FUNG|nr:hypothetical protein AYI68_g4043 [Smittium mucronatum]
MQENLAENSPFKISNKNLTPQQIHLSDEARIEKSTGEIVNLLDIAGVSVEVVRRNDKTIYRLPGNMTVKDLDPDKRDYVLSVIQRLHQESQKISNAPSGTTPLNTIPTPIIVPDNIQNSFLPLVNPQFPKIVPPSQNNFSSNVQINHQFSSVTPLVSNAGNPSLSQASDRNPSFSLQSAQIFAPKNSSLIAIKPRAILPITPIQINKSDTIKDLSTPLNMHIGMTHNFGVPIPDHMQTQAPIHPVPNMGAVFPNNNLHSINLKGNFINSVDYNSHSPSAFKSPISKSTPKLSKPRKNLKSQSSSKKPRFSSEGSINLNSKSVNVSMYSQNSQIRLAPNNLHSGHEKSVALETWGNNLFNRLPTLAPEVNFVGQIREKNIQITSPHPPEKKKLIHANLINDERYRQLQNLPKKSKLSLSKKENKKNIHSLMYQNDNHYKPKNKSWKNSIYQKNKQSFDYKNPCRKLLLSPKKELVKTTPKDLTFKRLITNMEDLYDLGTGVKPVDLISETISLPLSSQLASHVHSVKKKFESVLAADHSSLSLGNSTLQSPFRDLPDVIQRLLPYHIHAGIPILEDEVKNYCSFVEKSEASLINRISSIEDRINKLEIQLDTTTNLNVLALCIENARLDNMKDESIQPPP